MPKIQFDSSAFRQFIEWHEENPDFFEKIETLIRDIARDPFKGLGKPEPLKGDLKGFWSRRITLEHRLVYKIEPDNVFILSCRGHYD